MNMGLLEDFTEEELKEEVSTKKVEIEPEERFGGIKLQSDSKHEALSPGHTAQYKVTVKNETGSDQVIELTIKLLYSTDEDKRVNWKAIIKGEKTLFESNETHREEIELAHGQEKIIPITVEPPTGATYGEKFEVIVDATSIKDRFLSDSITLMTIARPTVIAVKTQIGQEKTVAEYIAGLAKRQNLHIYSILSPKPVKGYIFLEVMSPEIVEDAVSGMRKAKGVVAGESSIDEIEHFLTPKLAVEGIAEGDIVELSAGPFKGEKARVTKIDEANDEITVELFEATVPIPVTVRGDHVRVLEKEKKR